LPIHGAPGRRAGKPRTTITAPERLKTAASARPTNRSIRSTANSVIAMLTVETAAAVGSKSQVT